MSVVVVLALVFLAGCMILALCSNLLYWYETLNGPEPAIPAPRLGVFSCLFHYANTLGSYALCLLTVVISPFCRRRFKNTDGQTAGPTARQMGVQTDGHTAGQSLGQTPAQPPALPPLILIHGIYNGAAVWLYLGRRFAKAGFAVSTCSYRSFFISPERILRGIEEHVQAAEAAFPGQKPVFVCHSLGGVLVRHWLLAPGNKDRAGGVLTFGTPHRGSKVAALGPGGLIKRIMPAGELIRTLEDAPELSPLPCVSLVSPTDEAVLPAYGLLPPAGWRMRVTNQLGHFSMLFCPRVARMALEELDGIVKNGGRGDTSATGKETPRASEKHNNAKDNQDQKNTI